MRALLPALVLGLLPVQTTAATTDDDLVRAVRERLGLEELELAELSLPAGLPAQFEVAVTIDGEREVLHLERVSLRAEGFRLLVQREGRLHAERAPEPRTYRGHVLGRPGWIATASLDDGRLTAGVLVPEGRDVFVQPLPDVDADVSARIHVVYRPDPGLLAESCGADRLVGPDDASHGSGAGEEEGEDGGGDQADHLGGSGSCIHLAQIAFDSDHEYYLSSGSSSAQVMVNIEAVLNTANAMYYRDVGITHEVTQIVVRADPADPYSDTSDGGRLDEFRDHWNTVLAGVQRDMAHFVMGYDPPGNVIGLAYVGVVCNQQWGYGWSQFTFTFGTHANILGHELGHNWSAPHCLDPEPCNTMCGGCLVFGPNTQALVIDYRDSRTCLDPAPGDTAPWAPIARDDAAYAEGEVVIDVLENDLDGNCDPLSIDWHDATTLLGGTVTLSAGTGPGGRDELRYTPSPNFVDEDFFVYGLGDGTGAQDTATVFVHGFVEDPVLAAHYRLDETSGGLAADSSGNGQDGSYTQGPTLGLAGAAPGTATAVGFDGFNDHVSIPAGGVLDGIREDLAVTAWIRPDVTNGWRRVFGNDGSWTFGLAGNDLVFTTRGIRDHVLSASIQTGTWTHVAVVFDRLHDATFYLNGSPVGTVPGTLGASPVNGPWYVGARVPSSELWDGRIDDVQVYGDSISAAQVAALHENPGATLDDLGSVGTSGCFGDGSGSACPCANDSPTPERGCLSSAGVGMALGARGSTSVIADALVLTASDCPPFNSGIFYSGKTPIPGGQPLFDGLQCAGGDVRRYQGVFQTNGVASDTGFVAQDPSGTYFSPGVTVHFQYWTRDVADGPTPCGTWANFSPAVAVTMTP